MKTCVCFLISMLFASLAFAGNPDERSSMEVNLTKYFVKYDRSFSVDNSSSSERDKGGPINMNVKMIFPTKESLSLILGMGYTHEKIKLFDIEDKRSGFYLNFGMKFYLAER